MDSRTASPVNVTVVGSLKDIGRNGWDRLARPVPARLDAVDSQLEDIPLREPVESDSQPQQTTAAPPRLSALESDSQHEDMGYNPFLSFDFLSSLEDSGCVGEPAGWVPRYLALGADITAPDAVVAAYVKSHSQGEYVFDHAWADAFRRAGGRYYPKLQVSVPFTPVTGPRLLVGSAPGAKERRALLATALSRYARDIGASSVHATFLTPADADAFGAAQWLERTDQQFHWMNEGYATFDDFLAALASRKRKQVRRERRDATPEGITIERLTGKAITEADWDAFFAFYIDTGNRKWGRPYLNRRFFSLIGERMADDILLVIAKHHGRPVAGALNFIGSQALYGRNWGCLADIPFLHFEVCYYQAIEFAIERGLKRVEAGAQGEHKLARGYVPATTRSAHDIVHPGLRQAVAAYLVQERTEIARIGELLTEAGPYRRAEPMGFEAD